MKVASMGRSFDTVVLALFNDALQLVRVHDDRPFRFVPWRDWRDYGAIGSNAARFLGPSLLLQVAG